MAVDEIRAAWASPVTAHEKLVLLALADRATDLGLVRPVPVGVLARATGLSVGAVLSACAQLEKDGRIVLDRGRCGSCGSARWSVVALTLVAPPGDGEAGS